MSANLVVDIRGGADFQTSVSPAVGVGNTPASGTLVGEIVDLLHADTYCNVFVAGGPTSGPLQVRVQTSDSTASGTFTDPTSGLPASAFPSAFLSGGLMWVNSGLLSSGNQSISARVSGATNFASGGLSFGAFIRNGRYARLLAMSGTFTAPVIAGFVSNKKTTGSGGGFTYSPGSGVVSV